MKAAFKIGFELEEDGRWIAEVVELPGVMAYGLTKEAAQRKVETLSQKVAAAARSDSRVKLRVNGPVPGRQTNRVK